MNLRIPNGSIRLHSGFAETKRWLPEGEVDPVPHLRDGPEGAYFMVFMKYAG